MAKLISINPADNSVNVEVEVSSENEIREKVQRAHDAKALWKSYGIQKRIEILRPLINAFKKRENEIRLLTVKEMGKPFAETDLEFDFDYLEHFFNEAPHYLADEITHKKDQAIQRVVFEPRGVSASIAPWNFPFTNFAWTVIPNLIVGNTVVFKHSEICPLLGKLCEDVMNSLEGLPPGVFSEVYGAGDVGDFLANQDVDLICFIGSTAVGKKLAEIAGKKKIKAVLEMGGSNPAIVFDDADIDKAVQHVYDGRFCNAGQVCDAIKRLIIHESIYDAFVAKLSEMIRKINISDPRLESTQMGPLSSVKQKKLLESQVEDAIKLGAKVIASESKLPNTTGAYFAPMLLTNINFNMRVWKEEVFGPVLPIVTFKTEEEAIQLANDTPYGLGSHVYTKNSERARRVARLIDAGYVNINDGNRWEIPSNPFGGVKASGLGYEHGRQGFQELCTIKVIAEG